MAKKKSLKGSQSANEKKTSQSQDKVTNKSNK